MYTIEFQKRGLPHVHLLLFLLHKAFVVINLSVSLGFGQLYTNRKLKGPFNLFFFKKKELYNTK